MAIFTRRIRIPRRHRAAVAQIINEITKMPQRGMKTDVYQRGVRDGVPYQTTIRAKVCSKCRKIKEIKGITTTVYICDFCTAATHTVEAEPLPQTIPCVSENCNGKMRKEIEND